MNKPPKYKSQFDGVKYTHEETKQAYLDLFKILQKFEIEKLQKTEDILGEKKQKHLIVTLRDCLAHSH